MGRLIQKLEGWGFERLRLKNLRTESTCEKKGEVRQLPHKD